MSERRETAQALAIAPNTIAGLTAAIRARMAVVVARFPLFETKTDGTRRAATVVDGWLPPKPESEQFPFLIVRPNSGVDSPQGAEQDARATVTIVVGTFSDTDDGAADVTILIDAIRSELGERPTILGTTYEHVGPLTWDIPDQQSRPQWFGTVTTTWNIPRPRRVDDQEAA